MAKLMKDFIRIENNFTIIPNDILRNKEMKSSTKNILLTMFGLPPDWDFSIAGIASCVYEGHETVQKALVELEKMGYITRKRDRRENGTLGAMIYTVHQFPVSEEENTYKNNFSNQDVKKPKQEKTYIGENQYREKPVQDSKRQLRNDFKLSTDFELINDKNTNSAYSADCECEQPEPKNNQSKPNHKKEANALFEQLWSLYPLKKGKASVSDTQKLKLLDIGYEEMERTISRYVKYVDSVDYLHYKNGSTFFNSGYVDYLDENYTDGDANNNTHSNYQQAVQPKHTDANNNPEDRKEAVHRAMQKAAEQYGEQYGEQFFEGMSDGDIEGMLGLLGIDVV